MDTDGSELKVTSKRVFPPLYVPTGDASTDRLAFFHVLERLKVPVSLVTNDPLTISTRLRSAQDGWITRNILFPSHRISRPRTHNPRQVPNAERSSARSEPLLGTCSRSLSPAYQTTCTAWRSSPCVRPTPRSTSQSASLFCVLHDDVLTDRPRSSDAS